MRLPVLFLCVLSCACANTSNEKKDHKEVSGALTAPLKDLNLIHEKIPENLLEAKKDPYQITADLTCEQLQEEIQALDKVLAPDVDQPKKEKAKGFKRGVDVVGKESIKVIKRTTESVIPYRSWVRKLTGAERESRIVSDAIHAGNLRRAFLKGYKVKTCAPDSL